jgi:predicted adenine nucleotide alpha hydrolase (AANH) superfamily ATPase
LKQLSINYHNILDETLKDLKNREAKARVLMHACCAPCSSAVLDYLSTYKDNLDLTLYYYNPNIMPEAEYYKRLKEFSKLIDLYPAGLEAEGYDNDAFLTRVQGYEKEREGGRRCSLCFDLRLRKTAERARAEGYDFFCTTLTLSPHKNAELINKIGAELEKEYGVRWLYSDFKKKGGFQRSIELCKQLDIYRQFYCGCVLDLF